MLPLLWFILVCFPLVLIHEFGHFIVGWYLGAKPKEFSIGFGKAIYSRWIGRTQFKLGWIPLGGYVQFRKAQFAFEKNTTGTIAAWRWILIALAGPVANLITTLCLFFSLLFVALGQIKTDTKYVLYPEAPAVTKNLFQLEGEGPLYHYNTQTGTYRTVTYSTLPILKSLTVKERLQKATRISIFLVKQLTILTTKALGDIFTKEEGFRQLSGPVGVAKIAATAGTAGWISYLFFLAYLSFALGYFNLLPLSFLDGGRALWGVYEVIRGKQVSVRVFMVAQIISFVLFIGLLLVGLYSDYLQF